MSLDSEITTIIAGITSTIEAVASAGNVYDHQPYKPSLADFLAAYSVTIGGWTHLRAWVVQHASTRLEQTDFAGLGAETTFTVTGFLSESAAHDSEATMRTLALAVALALRQESSFGSTAVLDSGALELEGPVLAMVPNEQGTLCHRVVITLPLTLDQDLVWS